MIKHLRGTILEKQLGTVVIAAHDVGYAVYVPEHVLTALPEIGDTVSLWTHLSVRENAMDLYGFIERSDLDAFELLLNVSGIGPKGALAILSLDTTDKLLSAISAGDTSYLTSVSGIGPKSAKKIVIELQDKLKEYGLGEHSSEDADVLDALRALGYTLKESREALKYIPKEVTDTHERVKEALKTLGTR